MIRKIYSSILMSLLLLALFSFTPSHAQTINSPYYVTLCYRISGTTCTAVSSGAPLPVGIYGSLPPLSGATSTPLAGTATSSAVTPTSGSATFSGGNALIGPLSPVLGRPIILQTTGTWVGTVYAGTTTTNCSSLSNIVPLTVAGGTWASFTANANEPFTTPYSATYSYCLVATLTSGTLTYTVTQ